MLPSGASQDFRNVFTHAWHFVEVRSAGYHGWWRQWSVTPATLWQKPPLCDALGFLCFQVSLNVFFGKPGPWFEDCELDGDKNSIFHDIDGSVTGYKDAYVGRMDNYLIRHPNCVNVTKWNAVVCSGTYAQVGPAAGPDLQLLAVVPSGRMTTPSGWLGASQAQSLWGRGGKQVAVGG